MIKAGIVGATGYTGAELLRLLLGHPHVKIEVITSRTHVGEPLEALFPNLRGFERLRFSEPDVAQLQDCDVVFFATPHGVAHGMAAEILTGKACVIDLSADFRIQDRQVWEQWYGQTHGAPALIEQAVYGLPEVYATQIAKARLVAVPGCYPTAVTLGFLPLLESGLIDQHYLIADAKSGVSGAGRKAQMGTLLCEASENFKAYSVNGHRHLPEIRQTLQAIAADTVGLTFVPHLVPMIRGIEATLYARLRDPRIDFEAIQALYEHRYAHSPFVDVMPPGSQPETRSVQGTNLCRLAVYRPQNGDMLVISAVIDNLVKGASGQAIQNMNLMFGLPEKTGLSALAVLP
ncbi:N-acetyl-gamma-glutamyl-phosphate reductase [Thiorhodospira sibirica]|uniref:N-acetyl-gamma-glutamyl-phosphate reductase n=1 Tax=Thiorhodospira sibirica TaxID=154347 RepID=UPI00022C5978|nr:N-acetyl-gamma-glutamyl-phosphate reductase [Thiorhodospira sibirica]